MGRRLRWLVGGSAAALVLCGAAADAAQPVAQCPDPTMLIDGSASGAVTLMCTGNGFPTRTASSLRALSDVRPRPAFSAAGWPRWATGGFWAPDLESVAGRYLLYYSAQRRSDGRHCIGVAISSRPSGGFRDLGRPLIDDEADGAIDPALLSVGGRLFLFYKRDGNSVGAPSVIFGRALTADGLHLAGAKVALITSHAGGWERGIVEGPAPIQLGDTTYLLFSEGRFYGARYAEGEAVLTGFPLGRYRPVAAVPVLRGDGGWVGTGGASIVKDQGALLLAYEAFRPRQSHLRRLLFVRPLDLEGGILRPVGRPYRIPLRGP